MLLIVTVRTMRIMVILIGSRENIYGKMQNITRNIYYILMEENNDGQTKNIGRTRQLKKCQLEQYMYLRGK